MSNAQAVITSHQGDVISKFEPGSFRDRTSRVFYGEEGEIFRALDEKSFDDWSMLKGSTFGPRAMSEGKIVGTEQLGSSEIAGGENWVAVLQHERLPFVSYPYEWSFGMLKDAALLHLDLLLEALEEGMIIKDSSAYNIQWRGSQPVFIDIPSFERWNVGEPWVAYRQFCEMFLFPLMLSSYKGIPFHTLLRGDIDGIPVDLCNRLISFRDLFRSGCFSHVYLQSKLQTRYSDTSRDVKKELSSVGFHTELIKINVKKLKKLISKMEIGSKKTTWSDYEVVAMTNNTYTDETHQAKAEFVRTAVTSKPRNMVWDLGCNTGIFSRIAAESADQVIAMDFDHLAIEKMYQSLKGTDVKNILPLVVNVSNSSPAQGWRGFERKRLEDRTKPSMVLGLALMHHIVISANVPLSEFIDWLVSLESDLVLEFVTRKDPMVKKLLLNKEDNYADYSVENFEALVSNHYQVIERKELNDGERVMYHCVRSAN